MKRISFILIALVVLTATGCMGKKKAGKNMEQIQKEEGIPVRITEIKQSAFTKNLTYNATLTGIEESTVQSSLGGVIVKINASVGDFVKKDQVIVAFPQDSPAAQNSQAQSAYLNAKTTYERMQRLFGQGAISQQDMDNVTTAYNVAKANYNASEQMINVRAPISGTVTAIHVNTGDNVGPGTDLFTISNTNGFKAVIWVPDTEIKDLRKGMSVEAKWNDIVLKGKVNSIALTMDLKSKAFRSELVFGKGPKQLSSGVTAEVSVNILKIDKAIAIDRKSIIESEGKKFAWVVENDKAVRKEIIVGQDNGFEYLVTSGLTEGDKLITEGISMVYDGSLVKVTQ